MMKLRESRHLDSRQSTIVENAYYYCKPPEQTHYEKKRSPIELYIRKLIYDDLSKDTVRLIIKKLRKISWATHEVR